MKRMLAEFEKIQAILKWRSPMSLAIVKYRRLYSVYLNYVFA
ncbi:hypothetical protein HpMS105_05300 [Helicobacter pylori]